MKSCKKYSIAFNQKGRVNTFTAKPFSKETVFQVRKLKKKEKKEFPTRFLTNGLTKSKSVVYHLVGNFMTIFRILPARGATDAECQYVFTTS